VRAKEEKKAVGEINFKVSSQLPPSAGVCDKKNKRDVIEEV